VDEFAMQGAWGVEMPLATCWDLYAVRPARDTASTLKPTAEWETGRDSSPEFTAFNLEALKESYLHHKLNSCSTRHRVVLCQEDTENVSNPHGLLIAYEERLSDRKPRHVKPVVSDLDCFLIGARGSQTFAPLPPAQLELVRWEITHIQRLLDRAREAERQGKQVTAWMKAWMGVLAEHKMDREVKAGLKTCEGHGLGFGDATSIEWIEKAVSWTGATGAVRHGAESFNFYFPQDLDDQYLVTHHDLEGDVKHKTKSRRELRAWLLQRIDEGYRFPLNPKWLLCDCEMEAGYPSWYELWTQQIAAETKAADATKAAAQGIKPWFPQAVRDAIEAIHKLHPEGYPRGEAPRREDMAELAERDKHMAELAVQITCYQPKAIGHHWQLCKGGGTRPTHAFAVPLEHTSQGGARLAAELRAGVVNFTDAEWRTFDLGAVDFRNSFIQVGHLHFKPRELVVEGARMTRTIDGTFEGKREGLRRLLRSASFNCVREMLNKERGGEDGVWSAFERHSGGLRGLAWPRPCMFSSSKEREDARAALVDKGVGPRDAAVCINTMDMEADAAMRDKMLRTFLETKRG